MSLASEHRLLAFQTLLDTSGEEIEIMNGDESLGTVTAIVNRGLDELELENGRVDFEERNQSMIELLIADVVDNPPGVGKSFKDEVDMFHRIKSIKRTDITFRYMCETDPEDE